MKISKLRELEARKLLAIYREDEQISNIDLIDRLANILTGTPEIVTIAAHALKTWNQYGEDAPKFTFSTISTEDYYETMAEVVLNSAANYRGKPIEEDLANISNSISEEKALFYTFEEVLDALSTAATFLSSTDSPFATIHAQNLRNVAATMRHNRREVTPE